MREKEEDEYLEGKDNNNNDNVKNDNNNNDQLRKESFSTAVTDF